MRSPSAAAVRALGPLTEVEEFAGAAITGVDLGGLRVILVSSTPRPCGSGLVVTSSSMNSTGRYRDLAAALGSSGAAAQNRLPGEWIIALGGLASDAVPAKPDADEGRA